MARSVTPRLTAMAGNAGNMVSMANGPNMASAASSAAMRPRETGVATGIGYQSDGGPGILRRADDAPLNQRAPGTARTVIADRRKRHPCRLSAVGRQPLADD